MSGTKRIKTGVCDASGAGGRDYGILDVWGNPGEVHIVHGRGCIALKVKHAKRLAEEILKEIAVVEGLGK